MVFFTLTLDRMACMNVVVYLPKNFYASVASFVSEYFLALNAMLGRQHFNLKFTSKGQRAIARSGIKFPVSDTADQKIDLLIFIAGHSINLTNFEAELAAEIDFAQQVVDLALKHRAVIAGTCSASLLMAKTGLLDRKRATISWWAVSEARRLFPRVKWDATRIVIRHNNLYTSGGVYSAMDLLVSVLIDMGYEDDVKQVRNLLVMPPVRQLQSPYETEPPVQKKTDFEQRAIQAAKEIGLKKLNTLLIADRFSMTEKTLRRRFRSELDTTPSRWIQTLRISKAKEMLGSSSSTVSEICHRVGYDDHASFVRLFSRITGVTPSEYRQHIRI